VSGLRNGVLNKNRTMDNVQKVNNCISILSSQTSKSYYQKLVVHLFKARIVDKLN
jgi:hypothetical protein